MAWVRPVFSVQDYNSAARELIELEDDTSNLYFGEWADRYNVSLDVVNNWRSSHAYPLNTLQVNLRRAARRIDENVIVAQRTKRLFSITDKLRRFPKMKLSQMQDIGGCRAVLAYASNVNELDAYYSKSAQFKHRLSSRDDYLDDPKPSGYRGIHYVYRYVSDKEGPSAFNNLKIEMQLRSQYQHAWATAVETVGTFLGEALKASVGPDGWRRFFALMSSAIALREGYPLVPGTPQNKTELIDELRHFSLNLHVEGRLRSYQDALKTISSGVAGGHYFLLELIPTADRLQFTGYPRNQYAEAQAAAAALEKKHAKDAAADIVLVSVDSVTALQRAYPNYFADTTVFVKLMSDALKVPRARPLGPRM